MPDLPLAVNIAAHQNQSVRVLVLEGPLTLSNMFPFQTLVRADDSRDTIVNMTAVPYVDSAGIGCLVGAQLFHQRNGRTLALAGVNQRVHDVLKITSVDNLFTLYNTVDEAASALRSATA
jgi:anti-sigma B factor antagonist